MSRLFLLGFSLGEDRLLSRKRGDFRLWLLPFESDISADADPLDAPPLVAMESKPLKGRKLDFDDGTGSLDTRPAVFIFIIIEL